MTLEEISLLKTVFEKPDPVLLAKNLKSYIKNTITMNILALDKTYLNLKMMIEIGASRVFLV